jgi:HPt (histidine-containing phosphotransfer) domain-containing protein
MNTARHWDALCQIAEINTEIGLGYFSGMIEMYCTNVALFNKKLLAECDKMSAFISDGDIANFSISVHAMKSMLATIGAQGLSEQAKKLEDASKKSEFDYCAGHFPELKEKLLSLQGRLSVIFPDEEDGHSPVAKKAGDAASLRENVEKALAAAGDFDGDAGLEAVNNLLAYDFGEAANGLLRNAMGAFK